MLRSTGDGFVGGGALEVDIYYCLSPGEMGVEELVG